MTTTPALCAAILFTLTAPLAPAGSSPTARSAPLIQIEQAATTHYRLLLDQLERQFNDLPSAPDQNEATRAITRTMAALASKDVFTDWTAYQALRMYLDGHRSGPLASLAHWRIFRNRLKFMDDSLLRIEEFSHGKKRGLVAADAPPEFHELEYITYQRNALIARELEVKGYVSGLDHPLVMYGLIEEPLFDFNDPIIDQIFEPEFVIMVRRTLELHRERMYPKQVESDE